MRKEVKTHSTITLYTLIRKSYNNITVNTYIKVEVEDINNWEYEIQERESKLKNKHIDIDELKEYLTLLELNEEVKEINKLTTITLEEVANIVYNNSEVRAKAQNKVIFN